MIDPIFTQKSELPGGIPVEWRDFIILIRDRVLALEERLKEFEQVTIETLNSKTNHKTHKIENKPEIVIEPEIKPVNETFNINCETRNIINKAAKMFGKK